METVHTEVLQVYEANKAMIDSQVATAKAYPRKLNKCIENSKIAVTLSKEFAESCIYTIPRGNKKISGPSVNLAKIIMQNYGNFRAEARVVDEDAKRITCEAVAYDLENNVAIKVQVKRLIIGQSGRYNEDMITVTGNAGNSIALRNAVFAVVPKVIVDEVFEAAKKKIIGDVSDETKLALRRKKVIDGLKERYSITEKEILSSIGKETVDHIGSDEILALVGIDTAIKDGDTTVDFAFKGKKSKFQESEDLSIKDKRIIEMISNCKNEAQLNSIKPSCKTPETRRAFEEKMKTFTNKTNNNENNND